MKSLFETIYNDIGVSLGYRITEENYKPDDIYKSREFLTKVKKLANEYNKSFFIVTEGASMYSNNGCDAVKNARECHTKWEKEHGHDPYNKWNEKTLKGDGL